MEMARTSYVFSFLFAALLAGGAIAAGCGGTAVGVGDPQCQGPQCTSTNPTGPGASSNLPGPIGTPVDAGGPMDATINKPCNRNIECDSGLCNLETDMCSVPAGLGAPCARDSECASNLCNLESEIGRAHV